MHDRCSEQTCQSFESRRKHAYHTRTWDLRDLLMESSINLLPGSCLTAYPCPVDGQQLGVVVGRPLDKDIVVFFSVSGKNFTLRAPFACLCKFKHSQTSRKQPPKMQRFSGRLRDGVTYENWTTGIPFLEEVRTLYTLEDNSLHTISNLRYV